VVKLDCTHLELADSASEDHTVGGRMMVCTELQGSDLAYGTRMLLLNHDGVVENMCCLLN
jgi:hypothetical protein